MRRADRLLQIILLLRTRRFLTAQALAEALEVSVRTVYRDMSHLLCAGVPVEGEAGVGYRLRKGYDLPPLVFNAEELAALALGARMVAGWGDPELGRAAGYALTKIEAAVQERDRAPLSKTPLYVRADDTPSERIVRPLGLYFWGSVWTLVAWCDLRDDFRHFRLDRMRDLRVLPEAFAPTPGRTLQDFLARMQRENAGAAD